MRDEFTFLIPFCFKRHEPELNIWKNEIDKFYYPNGCSDCFMIFIKFYELWNFVVSVFCFWELFVSR